MAQLTWREMTAPDLSTSLRGYDQFTNLLNSALGGAREAVAGIDQKNKDLTNNQIQLALATAQDPAALKAALSDPAQLAKLDPSRINAQTIAAIGARPGQLTQQTAQELALKDSTRLYDQAVAADARAPLLAQAHDLNRQIGLGVKGAKEQFDAFTKANPDLLTGLGYKTTAEFQKGLEDAQKSGQDFVVTGDTNTRAWNADARAKDENTRQWGEYGMKKTEFGWRADDRRTDEIATGFVAQALAQSDPNDPESIRAAVFANPALQGQSGKVKAAVYARISETFPGLFRPDDVGAPGGAPAGGTNANPWNTVVGNGQYGTPPKDLTSMTLGEVYNFGRNTLIPNTKAAGVGRTPDGRLLGSSAVGTYQIVGSTLQNYAPRVLGKDWQSKPFTPENQDKIAEAIYNDNKNSAAGLMAQWASLKPNVARALVGKPWSQARAIIAAGETSASPASLGGSTPAVQAGIALRRGQENQGLPEANDLVAAGSRDANPLDVIDQLKSNPRFAGTSRQFIKSALDDIVNKGTITGANGQRIQRVNYAQAAIILQRATQENNSSWGITNWLNNNSVRINKNGDRINYGLVDELTNGLKSGNLQGRVAREADLANASGQIAAAQAAADAALANLNRITDRARSQPQLAGSVQTAQAKYAAMLARLEALKRQVGPSTQPIPAAPQPTFSQQASSMFNDIVNGSLFKVRRTN